MRATRWAWSALAILLVVAVVSQRGILLVFVLILGMAVGASELWARYCLSQVSYRRKLANEQLSFGEETTLSLEFINAKPLPLAWLSVRDEFPTDVELLSGELRSSGTQGRGWLSSVVALRWYERLRRTHHIRGVQRGVFQLGPATLTSGDVFGYQRRSRIDAPIERLVVYPKRVPVEALGLPAGRPVGDWLAHRAVVEDPLRFSTVREYMPGDNPRFVHWKASARTGKLQSKVFEASDTLSVVLAVDVQTLPRAYEFVHEYVELACSAAASLAEHILEQRYMVGLASNALAQHKTWVYVKPGRHPQQLPNLLATLASFDAYPGITFAHMLVELAARLPYGASVVAISARPNDDVFETLLALEESGHRVLLLTIGEQRPEVPERLAHHHLGGRDAWHRLEALELD